MNSNDIPARSGQEVTREQKIAEIIYDFTNVDWCGDCDARSNECGCNPSLGKRVAMEAANAVLSELRKPQIAEPSPAADCAFVQVTGGLCSAHGEYQGTKCPQWPLCAIDPPVFQPSPAAAETPHKATIWPACDWCGTELDKWGKAGKCPKCGAIKFPDAAPAPGKAPVPEEPKCQVCHKPEFKVSSVVSSLADADKFCSCNKHVAPGPHTENQPPAWAIELRNWFVRFMRPGTKVTNPARFADFLIDVAHRSNEELSLVRNDFLAAPEPSAAPEAQGANGVLLPDFRKWWDGQPYLDFPQNDAELEVVAKEYASMALAAHPPAVPRCPKCHSKNIDVTYSSDDYALAHCRECQHQLGGKLVAQFFTRQDSKASATQKGESQ